MRRTMNIGFMVMLSAVLAGCAIMGQSQPGHGSKSRMNVAGPAKLDHKGVIEINGKGFQAGMEVFLLFTTEDGVQSDIGYALEPPPRADDGGMWTTKWSYGRFVKKKLIHEGEYILSAVDHDFNPLCKAKIRFQK